MPTILQLRRGSTAENDAYTGSVGEITVDTTLSTVRLHDGSTAGGSLVGNLQKNIQLGITGDNEIDTSSGNLTIDSAGGTVTIDDNLNISGTTTVSGHILPDADVTYDLGSSSFKFRDIYLSGTSINLGSATITASGSSIVLPSGSTISGGTGNLATESYVDTAVANVIDSAPGALDTLNELAAALGDDANYASTTTTALSNRLRIDTNAQGLTSTQKSNAITNLGLSTVATSGSYNDLSDKPTITSTTINNNADNRIITGSATAGTLNAESGITFNNNRLAITGAGGINCTSVNANNIGNNEFLELRGGGVTGGIKLVYSQSGVGNKNAILIDETTELMSFDIDVGIRNTNPTEALDVTGNIVASGNITADGLTLTGTLTAGGGVGTSGQVLKSTGTGVEWGTASSGSALTIQDEGTPLTTDATTLNFVGSGVTASGTGSTKTITISGGAADLSAVAEDILPALDGVYDIGSTTTQWYDGFFTNSVNIDTISLTNSSGTLVVNSDVSVGSLLVDSLLLSENTITADASTALQYLGDKGVVEINNSNLDVREGDWIGVPAVETTSTTTTTTTTTSTSTSYNDTNDFSSATYNNESPVGLTVSSASPPTNPGFTFNTELGTAIEALQPGDTIEIQWLDPVSMESGTSDFTVISAATYDGASEEYYIEGTTSTNTPESPFAIVNVISIPSTTTTTTTSTTTIPPLTTGSEGLLRYNKYEGKLQFYTDSWNSVYSGSVVPITTDNAFVYNDNYDTDGHGAYQLSSTLTLEAGKRYVLTSSSGVTAYLPDNPTVGDSIEIRWKSMSNLTVTNPASGWSALNIGSNSYLYTFIYLGKQDAAGEVLMWEWTHTGGTSGTIRKN
jgi:hypothetical protein